MRTVTLVFGDHSDDDYNEEVDVQVRIPGGGGNYVEAKDENAGESEEYGWGVGENRSRGGAGSGSGSGLGGLTEEYNTMIGQQGGRNHGQRNPLLQQQHYSYQQSSVQIPSQYTRHQQHHPTTGYPYDQDDDDDDDDEGDDDEEGEDDEDYDDDDAIVVEFGCPSLKEKAPFSEEKSSYLSDLAGDGDGLFPGIMGERRFDGYRPREEDDDDDDDDEDDGSDAAATAGGSTTGSAGGWGMAFSSSMTTAGGGGGGAGGGGGGASSTTPRWPTSLEQQWQTGRNNEPNNYQPTTNY